MYSQNDEDTIVSAYFDAKYGENYKGTLIDLGANDGRTLSNSLMLIQRGWNATLVEASREVAQRCVAEHKGNDAVQVINVGVANQIGKFLFHESGEHLGNGDHALLSTFDERQLARWDGLAQFARLEVDVVDFPTLMDMSRYKSFDFVSMDIEGLEPVVLPQMNLSEVQCLCIEFNSNPELLKFFTEIATSFGLNEIHRNLENVIFAR